MLKLIRLLVLLTVVALVAMVTSCEILMGGNQGGDLTCSHSWKDATCSAPKTCSICGAKTGKPLSHKYNAGEIIASTCTDQGYTLYTCTLCGAEHKDLYMGLSEHIESDWIFVKEPTDDTPGEKHKICTACDKILKVEVIEPHIHDLVSVEALDATCEHNGHTAYEYCTICGYNDYTLIPAIGHAYTEWVSNGDSTHTRVCENNATHNETRHCSGGETTDGELAVCEFCNAEYTFTVRNGNSDYGYYALGAYSNGEAYQKLYNMMKVSCENLLCSELDIDVDDHGYYVIGTYDFAALDITSEEAMGVWKIFYIDNPLYYWLSSTTATVGDSLLLVVDEHYAEYSYRLECDAAIAEITSECLSLINDDMDELDKAMTIVSYIVKGMEYAYDREGNPESAAWAHNMTGFAIYEYGVCEAYAKTFMYLCLLNDIDCIIGSGYGGGEKHAWNYISIEGEWYGVDITWTDNSGSDVVFDVFGMSDEEFHDDHILHPTDSFGVDFTYAIPEISDTSLELCELIEDGVSLGIYTSLEAAMTDVMDPLKEYIIKVGYYSFYVGAPEYTLDTTALPHVKKLTIIGVNQAAEPGYLDKNTVVNISSDLKLTCNLVLENVELRGEGTLKLNGNKLTLGGDMVYLDVKVAGENEPSEVEVVSVDRTYFNKGVDLYKLISENSIVVFGADSKIKFVKCDDIYTTPGVNVELENRIDD